MPTYKLAPNIAATVEIKYLDIVGSKYGPQIRVNGKADGADNYVYLPGNLPDQLTQLITAGVIANAEYPMDVEEGGKPVAVKALKKRIQIALDQPAGQKHGALKIVALSNGTAPQGAPAAAAPSSGATFPPLANASAAPGERAAPAAPAPASEDATRAEKAKHATAMKQAVAYTLDNIVPLYVAKDIGLTGDEVYKHAFSIWKQWEEEGLVR